MPDEIPTTALDALKAENEMLRGHIRRLTDPDGGEDDDIRAARAAIAPKES